MISNLNIEVAYGCKQCGKFHAVDLEILNYIFFFTNNLKYYNIGKFHAMIRFRLEIKKVGINLIKVLEILINFLLNLVARYVFTTGS